MAKKEPIPKEVKDAARVVADTLDADIYVYSGPLYPPTDSRVIATLRRDRKRKNGVLYLTTQGGSPDAAYRIARAFQNYYADGQFILFVNAHCKSAGTLIAVGANQIVMSDNGQLGPLDIQVPDKDEVWALSSGLTGVQALKFLEQKSMETFLEHFKALHDDHDFPTKLASEVATNLTVGLFKEIYGQLDPLKLGENQRAQFIGLAYGNRLARGLANGPRALEWLCAGYPSHGFVIDRTEAQSIFSNVRAFTPAEEKLIAKLVPAVRQGWDGIPTGDGTVFATVFAEPPPPNTDIKTGDHHDSTMQDNGGVVEAAKSDDKAIATPGEPKPAATTERPGETAAAETIAGLQQSGPPVPLT